MMDPEELAIFTLDIRLQLESLLTRREAMVQENAQRALKLEKLMFDRTDFMNLSREISALVKTLRDATKGNISSIPSWGGG